MKHPIFFLFALLFGLTNCSTHQGLKPIQPEVRHYSPVVVESLAPTFRWQPVAEASAQYDLVIFEILESGKPGKAVYYREALKDTVHQIEETLRPNSSYYWTVRSRQGATAGDWANYDHRLLVPIPFGFYYQGQGSLLFPFKTPEK